MKTMGAMGGAVDNGGNVENEEEEDDEASNEALVGNIEEQLSLIDLQ